ncbi:MAG: rhodanese-like domain-containing protein [Actinomycetota bacterium]
MDEYISPQDTYDRREEVQILDVREQFEVDAGRIEGAVHIPLNDLMAGKTEGLDPGKPVVAYCKTANRSEVARLMLRAKGFDAATMEGGGEAWVQQGLPFPTPTGEPGVCA